MTPRLLRVIPLAVLAAGLFLSLEPAHAQLVACGKPPKAAKPGKPPKPNKLTLTNFCSSGQQSFGSVATSNDLNGLQSQVNSHTNSINSHSSQISSLNGTLSGVASNVSTQGGLISTLQFNIADILDGSFKSEGTQSAFSVNQFAGNATSVLSLVLQGKNSRGPQMRFEGPGNFFDIGQRNDGTFVIERGDDPVLRIFPFGSRAETALKGIVTVEKISDQPGQQGFLRVEGAGVFEDEVYIDGNLSVIGTASKPGGGSWTATSDARLKKDIRPLEGALDRLGRLESVTYEFKDPAGVGELPGRQIGFTAQQVETVFPEWVGEREDGIKVVTVRGFESLTVQAMKELRAEKDAELASLRTEVETLVAENAALRGRLASFEQTLERLAAAEAERGAMLAHAAQ